MVIRKYKYKRNDWVIIPTFYVIRHHIFYETFCIGFMWLRKTVEFSFSKGNGYE